MPVIQMPATVVLAFRQGADPKGRPQWEAEHPDYPGVLFLAGNQRGQRTPSEAFRIWSCTIAYQLDRVGKFRVVNLHHPAKMARASVAKRRVSRNRMDPALHATIMDAKADRARRNAGMEISHQPSKKSAASGVGR